MLKDGRGTREYTTGVALTLSPMPLVTHVLGGGGGGGTMLARATDESGFAGLPPRAVPEVHGVLRQLSQQEEQIVRMRYGIGTRMHSVDEISERLGVLPRHVERLELRAFRKLRETAVASEPLDRPVAPAAPFHSGERPPVRPVEPQPLPEDSDCEANPWDEV